MINLIGLLLSLVAGACAYAWMPLGSFIGIKEGLIAYLGFLSAAVIQVIPVTANFLQGEDLTPDQTTRLNDQLGRQQLYWIGLLAVTVFALVVVICVSAIPVAAVPVEENVWRWDRWVSAGMATLLAFLFSRMLGIFTGVLSLHRLRASLNQAAAIARARERSRAALASMDESSRPVLPEGYGDLIRPEAELH